MDKERIRQAVEMVKARAGRIMQRARGSATADLSTAGSKPRASGQTGQGQTGEERSQRVAGSAVSDDTQ